MAIKGDLWSMDLTQVLQMLSLNHKEGRLVIDLGPCRRKSVLFGPDGVTLLPICDLNDEGTLAHVIRRRNIAGGSLAEARKKYERFDKPLVDALREIGLLKRSWLLPLLRERIQSQLLDLFFLTAGKFTFHEEPVQKYLRGLDEEEREAFFFQVEEIVMEGSHRLDEWAGIRELIPTTDEIFHPVRAPGRREEDGMPPETAEVLRALDGVRDVEEVVETTQFGLYKVCGHLASLLREGRIQPVEPPALHETACTLFQNGRLDDALRIFHRLLTLTDGDPEIRLKIALICERQGEYLKAARQYRALAEHQLREGAIVPCYDYYQTVLRLIPTDIDVLGRLIGLYLRYRDRCRLESFDVVEGARVLVQVLTEMNAIDRAVDLLQRLVKAEVDIHHSRRQLIQLYLKQGRHGEAAAELEHVGQGLLQAGNRSGAVKVYRQVLKLDPRRRDVAQILDDIDEDRRRARQRRRRRHGLVRSSLYLGVFVASYLYYGFLAARELKAVDLDRYLAAKRFDPARRRLGELIDRFPFSPAAMEARKLLRSIEVQHADYLRELEAHRGEQEEAERRNLETAKRLFERARVALARSDLGRGLDLLQRARRLSAAHPDWRREVGLDRNLAQLATYQKEATRLRRQAEALLEAGRYGPSYALFVRLHRDYLHAASARNLRAPVRLASEPTGATVTLNGEVLEGKTPMVVRLPLDGLSHLTFSRPGYETVEMAVRASASGSRRAVLPRLPDFTIPTRVPLRSSPRITGDLLVAGGRGGEVMAVDLERERRLWVATFSGLNDHAASPAVTRRGIFTGSVDSGLFCLDPRHGRKVWRLRTGTYFPSCPLVVGEMVVAGDSAGTLWCVWSGKGNEAWRRETGGAIVATPVHAGGMVYVANTAGDLLAYALAGGRERHRIKLEGGVSVAPAAADDILAVVTDTGRLYGLDRHRFQVRWTEAVDGRPSAPLVVDGDRLYVTLADGRLLRFDLRTGRKDVERFQAACRLRGAPLVRPEGVYLGGTDGRLYVLDRRSLQLRWSTDLGSPIECSVVAWRDEVIVATRDGTIHGFPPGSPGDRGPPRFQGRGARHR